MAEAARQNRRVPPTLTAGALALLAAHDYPGNIRELRNLMERIVILCAPDGETLDDGDIRPFVPHKTAKSPVGFRAGVKLSELVTEAERAIVLEALEANGHVVADTARALGVERSNFHKKLKSLGLR